MWGAAMGDDRLLGPEVGHKRPECTYWPTWNDPTTSPCGAPAVWHLAVTNDPSAVTSVDPDAPNDMSSILDLSHPSVALIWTCADHEAVSLSMFRWWCGHEPFAVCSRPEAMFSRDCCLLPDDVEAVEAVRELVAAHA